MRESIYTRTIGRLYIFIPHKNSQDFFKGRTRRKRERERRLEHPLDSRWIRESFFVPSSGFLRHIRQVRARLRLKVYGSKFHFDFHPRDVSGKDQSSSSNPLLPSSISSRLIASNNAPNSDVRIIHRCVVPLKRGFVGEI